MVRSAKQRHATLRSIVHRRIVHHHSIASARLRPIQRLVRAVEHLLRPVARRLAGRHADRHRQRERQRRDGDALADAFGHLRGLRESRVGQQDQEFLAAQSSKEGRLAHGAANLLQAYSLASSTQLRLDYQTGFANTFETEALPGALPRVIRVLVHCYADEATEARHVYLREAVSLRKDLQGAQ